MTDLIDRRSPLEPTVGGAVWRYRWLVLVIAVVSVVLGFVFAQNQAVSYEAVSSVVIQDPRSSFVFDQEVQNPQRYVANQVAILESAAVADRARAFLGEETSVRALVEATTVTSSEDSDLVEVRFSSGDADTAIAGANAIITVYEQFAGEASAAGFTTAIAQLDRAILAQGTELDRIQGEIGDIVTSISAAQPFRDEFEAATTRFDALQTELAEAIAARDTLIGSEVAVSTDDLEAADAEITRTRDELGDLLQQFQIIAAARSEPPSPGLELLSLEQQEVLRQRSALITRRDEIQVDAQLESSGVILASQATEATQIGLGLDRVLLVSLVIAGLLGAGVSYLLALRRERFEGRLEPEAVLGAPFLAEIPEFRTEAAVSTKLPVRDSPSSASAEAFRFLLNAVEGQFARNDHGRQHPDGVARGRSLAVFSSGGGDGTTAVTANMALAATRGGYRVLAIDGVYGDQSLAELLAGESPPLAEFADVISGVAPVESLIMSVQVDQTPLDVIGLGLGSEVGPEILRTEEAEQWFASLVFDYDLVLIDVPPILWVAYASTLIRYASSALIVVPDGGSIALAQDVRERLDLTGTPSLGYVYSRVPLGTDPMYGSTV